MICLNGAANRVHGFRQPDGSSNPSSYMAKIVTNTSQSNRQLTSNQQILFGFTNIFESRVMTTTLESPSWPTTGMDLTVSSRNKAPTHIVSTFHRTPIVTFRSTSIVSSSSKVTGRVPTTMISLLGSRSKHAPRTTRFCVESPTTSTKIPKRSRIPT